MTDVIVPNLENFKAEKDGTVYDLDAVQLVMGGRSYTVWSRYTVTIYGTAKVGQTLSANIDPADAVIYGYQWFRTNNMIVGATSRTYTLTASDVGYAIKCRVYQNLDKSVYVDSAYTDVTTGYIPHSGALVTMTSNTAPSPYVASAAFNGWGSSSDSSPTEAWKVFDNDDSTSVRCSVNSSVNKHGITASLTWTNAIRLKKLYVDASAVVGVSPSAYSFSIFNAYLEGLKTDGNWELLASKTMDVKQYNGTAEWKETISMNNTTTYTAVRIRTLYGSGDAGQVQYVKSLTVQGWETFGQ